MVSTLVERKLVKIVGRKQVVGRPFLYGTTREFLERFGLNDLSDLPKVEDMSELLGFDLPATRRRAAPQTALPFEPDDDGDASVADAVVDGESDVESDGEPEPESGGSVH